MKKVPVVLMISALITSTVMAKESVTVKDKFDVVEDSQIDIHVPVGELKLTTHDGHYIELNVEIEEQDHSWFSSADLDDVQLSKKIQHSRVYLEIDEDDTKQTWQISVPADANINLDMGVGEAKLKQVSRDIKAELGVGELSIKVNSDDYKSINLESGVGEASLHGFKQSESSRALVSEEVYWQGTGQYMIDAQVGVGEVSVSR